MLKNMESAEILDKMLVSVQNLNSQISCHYKYSAV